MWPPLRTAKHSARPAAANPQPTTLHLEAKAPDPKPADSRGTGGLASPVGSPELSPTSYCAPCPLHAFFFFFCWVLVLLHQKKKKKYLHVHRQPQNKGSNNPSAPRLTNQHDKPAVLCEPGRPRREAGGSRLRASGPSEGPVGEELLQLPGNGECKDLVRRQEGAQGFAAQVLER